MPVVVSIESDAVKACCTYHCHEYQPHLHKVVLAVMLLGQRLQNVMLKEGVPGWLYEAKKNWTQSANLLVAGCCFVCSPVETD